MPTEYFEQRERALLGERFDALYAAPQETAERGVTVSALRTTPEQFAAKADFSLEASPFCKAAFVVHQPDFKPGRHPYHLSLIHISRPMGCSHNLCVSVTGIKDKFALEGEELTREYASIALGAAFHPYFVGGTFDPEAVGIEKQMLKKALEDEINEKRCLLYTSRCV